MKRIVLGLAAIASLAAAAPAAMAQPYPNERDRVVVSHDGERGQQDRYNHDGRDGRDHRDGYERDHRDGRYGHDGYYSRHRHMRTVCAWRHHHRVCRRVGW